MCDFHMTDDAAIEASHLRRRLMALEAENGSLRVENEALKERVAQLESVAEGDNDTRSTEVPNELCESQRKGDKTSETSQRGQKEIEVTGKTASTGSGPNERCEGDDGSPGDQ